MPQTPFTAASLVGQTLDEKYLIEQQLGAGGMGTVFRALHVGTQRRVAVKIITPELMTTAEYLERFKREARAAGRLQHPNVVNVTDFGVTQRGETALAYLAMEYLEGFTLSTLLRSGNRPALSQAIDVLEQVAIAVDEAHRAGIVHRDLKPDNIWLRPDGRGGFTVKVLDFGVASVRELPAIETIRDMSADETVRLGGERKPASVSDILHTLAARDPNAHLTRAGTMIGTPAYMSPEQCTGAGADARSDIYSLGVIAFQMLTGQLPFAGDTLELIAKHIAGAPPDPREIRHDLPKGIAETILASLAKDPAKRPPSAVAFAGAIRARSEGPTMILRRALAAYCLHVEEFLALAWIATSPVFAGSVFAAVVLLLLPRVLGAGGSLDAGAVAGASSVVPMIAALGLCIVAALALFGVANERMLIAPFEPLRAEEIAKDVARRLGAADAGSRLAFWMALSRLTAKYLKVAASPRDWAHAELFLVTTVVDGLSEEQAIAAAREQGRTLPSSRWLLIVFYIVLSLLPMVLGFLLAAGLLGAIGVHPEEAAPASVAFAFLLFAFGELLWLPAWAMGYAILHQRAQQALGKSVEIFTPAEGRVTASAAVSADGITHT